jgi:hypothetical protein
MYGWSRPEAVLEERTQRWDVEAGTCFLATLPMLGVNPLTLFDNS